MNGGGFAHILSSAYNGTGNTTAALQEAESRLQILAMKGLNAMACQKVDSILKVTTDPTPAGLATATKSRTETEIQEIMAAMTFATHLSEEEKRKQAVGFQRSRNSRQLPDFKVRTSLSIWRSLC